MLKIPFKTGFKIGGNTTYIPGNSIYFILNTETHSRIKVWAQAVIKIVHLPRDTYMVLDTTRTIPNSNSNLGNKPRACAKKKNPIANASLDY